MAECDQVKLLLGPFDDGELEPHEMEEVALHVVNCGLCKTTLDDYRSLGVVLRDSLPQLPMDGFTAAVLKRIAPAPRPWRRRLGVHLDTLKEHVVGPLSLVTAGAFVALLTAWLLTPYAEHLLHHPSNLSKVGSHNEEVASSNQNDLTAATPELTTTRQSVSPDQSEPSVVALSNDPTTTVIWLPNQP
ncbi:MAG: zf-HC2 domain-containing protein [Deltaproteobacteria bacterium]|nr:zf-HC2 domain-containing protein [Deltaproteobacteria bacterium]